MALTENQIRYGINHLKSVDSDQTAVVDLAHYQGETKLTINCTQLDFNAQFGSPAEKKRILREWCDFLKANPATFKELRFGTRMPQELFDAVCHQRKLVALDIKWGAYEDLSGLEKLRDLRATA